MNQVSYETIGAKTGNLKTTSDKQFYINEKNIDTTYSNEDIHVETINVTGREMLTQDLETVVPKGLNGSQIISSQLKPRILEIKLSVEATKEAMKSFYSRFMQDLLDLKSVKFRDESLYYFGAYTDSKIEEVSSTNHIITVEVLCNDVFKYTALKTKPYAVQQTIKSALDTQLPVRPAIQIQLTNDVKSFFIYVQDSEDAKNKYYVYFESETYLPRNIEINFKDLTVTGNPKDNPVDLMHTVRIDSDVENFKVKSDDTVYFSVPFSSLYFVYRGVYL